MSEPIGQLQIEVTPEMIEAGVRRWELWAASSNGFPETLVKSVFRSMRRVELRASATSEAN